MRLKLKIQAKLLVYILGVSILIFGLSSGYINYKSRLLALKDAEKFSIAISEKNALKVEKKFSGILHVVQTLSHSFSTFTELPEQEWKSLFSKMSEEVYDRNPSLFGLSASWDLNRFDTAWAHDYGRYFWHIDKDKTGKRIATKIVNSNGQSPSKQYAKARALGRDMLWDPYEITIKDGVNMRGGNDGVAKIGVNISSPISINNEFCGWVVADYITDQFDDIMNEINPFNGSEVYFISDKGQIIWYSDNKAIGKNFAEYRPSLDNQFNITTNRDKKALRGVDINGNDVIFTTTPINIVDGQAPWILAIQIPVKEVLKESNKTFVTSIVVTLIGIIILSLLIIFVSKDISRNVILSTKILKKLSLGDIDNLGDLSIVGSIEMEDMAKSVNTLKTGLKETSMFAEKIGDGNLKASFSPLSDMDVLGNSLLSMRKSLLHAEDEERKRKLEDDKGSWTTNGLAKFGDVLRENADNIETLSYNIISKLIDYLDANQGALFIIDDDNDDETYLELKSAVAYGRDKYMKKRIAIGESLVGRCAFENKTIYITNVPNEYIQITSGMGTSNPNALLLVPLTLNDSIFGVIEVASFNSIEKHQIEFVEKLGENIASTISTVKVNEKTSKLLQQSQSQSEELAAQEEEMRQNLEELQATQEEAARREDEMASIISALGDTAYVVEYDLSGAILSCNEKYANILGQPQEQIIGQMHNADNTFGNDTKLDYNTFWSELKRGVTKKIINKANYNNKQYWIEENYTPITASNEDRPHKILKIGFDITEQKNKEIELQEKLDKLT